jgi:hypothetical protein
MWKVPHKTTPEHFQKWKRAFESVPEHFRKWKRAFETAPGTLPEVEKGV